MIKKLFKILFILGFIGFISIISTIIYIFQKYNKDLPDHEQLKSYYPAITTRIYARDGSLMEEYSKEKRIFVPIEIIPKRIINAFISAEDSNFYNHSGIDIVAIARAAIDNVISVSQSGQISGGASTITQQVVKNFLLSNERSLERKVKEAILAIRMSKYFTKEEVLELYLNQIYLGSGSYGIVAAAQTYFNKSINDLTIEEAALLAALPKAPSKLDPYKNKKKARARRDWVIDRMLDENYINGINARKAKESDVILNKANIKKTKAHGFSDLLKKELTNMYGSDNVFENGIVVRTTLDPKLQEIAAYSIAKGFEEYDKRHGYRGALTSIDLNDKWRQKLQEFKIVATDNQGNERPILYRDNWKKAVIINVRTNKVDIAFENEEENQGQILLEDSLWAKKYIKINETGPDITAMSDIFKKGDVVLVEQHKEEGRFILQQIPTINGGLIAMNPHNGNVLAMMGGYIDALNQFNRVFQAKRQPGSILKTFGYLTALENGFSPASIIMDEEIILDQGEEIPPYRPKNYSGKFYGPVPLRKGLEKSINVTTVRLASEVGIDKIADTITKFGINDNPKPIYSLVLGSTETNLIKLASAYSTIASGGKEVKPNLIEKIQDRHGKTIYKRDNRICDNCQFNEEIKLDQKIPFPKLTDDRKQITSPEVAYQMISILRGVVERGTGIKAKWLKKNLAGKTGTTNSSFDSWFVGFSPDLVVGVYAGFDNPATLGEKETGSSIALPIFVKFMYRALKNEPAKPFPIPKNIKFIKIDKNTGSATGPLTEKKDIIFEAFKEGDEILNKDNNVSNDNEMNLY
ncbi:PBP1A family penicillin-binding protein [Rickettsiales bacterium]|nr:PBP1A family penicillin-binding protein [Rickettsiales bacterium]